MKYKIGKKIIEIDVDGFSVTGNDYCLLERDDNLISGCLWEKKGFIVSPFLDQSAFDVLRDGVRNLLLEALFAAGVKFSEEDFSLENYHEYCRDQSSHLQVVKFLRSRAAIENLPIGHQILDDQVRRICGKYVSCKVAEQAASGYFFIRLVRPQPHHDNNPPHKDSWLPRLRNSVNLYLPLAGSDENSSLPLVPGSHLWKESRVYRTVSGSIVNGVPFTVPTVVMNNEILNMMRPRVNLTEGMLFSPYLIHGGAVNFNKSRTRVSLEIRFWRTEQF